MAMPGTISRTTKRVPAPKIVALHLRGVPDLEYTAIKMLTEGEKRQRERGVELWLVGMNPQVLDVIQRSELGEVLGRDALFYNLEIAVAKYLGEAGPAPNRKLLS